ncbi:PaaI family thioesterase [Streptomyces chryseus]
MGRSRTYEWSDPTLSVSAARNLTGLEFLREIASEMPSAPVSAALGFAIEDADYGRVVFSLVPGEEHYNATGSVHGGVYATLLDSAAGCAVLSTLQQGLACTSLDLSVKFVRPITVDTGKVRAVGTVLSSGRRTALAQAELYDQADRLLAHATSNCLLLPLTTSSQVA